jgi:hypothetical protein
MWYAVRRDDFSRAVCQGGEGKTVKKTKARKGSGASDNARGADERAEAFSSAVCYSTNTIRVGDYSYFPYIPLQSLRKGGAALWSSLSY